MHPISQLQAALVAALEADPALVAITGAGGVFDGPPRDRPPPYVVIDRHDVRQSDGDGAPGQEHLVVLHCWADRPSRKAALDLAEIVVARGAGLSPAGLAVTHADHRRTQTMIDTESGYARAAVTLRFFTE